MALMLCRNKVRDYVVWKQLFDSHAAAHRDAGLTLLHLWRSLEDPNDVFFLFGVADVERARAFVIDPDNLRAGDTAGVLEGEMYFLEDAPSP